MILPAIILALLAQEADVAPIERREPVYPMIGAMYGIEANCQVRFDVNAEGRTENMCAVCATSAPPELPASAMDYVVQQFMNASQDAVAEWRYTSIGRLRPHVQTQFIFRLRDEHGNETNVELSSPSPDECDSNRISYLSTPNSPNQGLNSNGT